WDDDLDVLMTRADFERFAQLFREKYPDKYELTIPTETKESGALYIYPKIHMLGTTMLTLFDNPEVGNHGIHIDIFLIDNAPANGFKRRLKGYVADGKRFLLASGMMYAQRNETAEKYFSASGAGKRNYKIRMAVGRFACALGLDNVLRRYDRFVRQDKESPVSTVPTGRGHYAGEILPTSVFTPAKSVPYEDTTAFIPCDTDAYLKNLFGDYMTLPPEDKRERHSYVKLIID
ncbi:MAG: LicD family protein, partial [Lachnospiraceae bacterium]|nr:LicD family protein [Lachnospiraceae bacterium]